MLLAQYNLTPNEKKQYTIEYAEWLNNAETILSKTFVVQDVTVPPLVVSGDTIDVSGTLIAFFVNGGVDEQIYDVIVKITTSLGQIKEDHVIWNVRDA